MVNLCVSNKRQKMNFFGLGNRYATVKPLKNVAAQGTMRFDLHKKVQNSLAEGHTTALLFDAVKVPAGVDENEWFRVNMTDFYNKANIVYSLIYQDCVENNKKGLEQCKKMTAGPSVLYLWRDSKKYKKPTELCAHEYMTVALDWIEEVMADEKLFPAADSVDVKYPKTFRKTIKDLFKKMFRVFAHAMYSHFETLKRNGHEAQVNIWLKQFLCFALEHTLLKDSDLEPLHEWIKSHMNIDAAKFLSKKKKAKKEAKEGKAVSRKREKSVIQALPTGVNEQASSLTLELVQIKFEGITANSGSNSSSSNNSNNNQQQSLPHMSQMEALVEINLLKDIESDKVIQQFTTSTKNLIINSTLSASQQILPCESNFFRETVSFLVPDAKQCIELKLYEMQSSGVVLSNKKKELIAHFKFPDLHFLLDEAIHDEWFRLTSSNNKQQYSVLVQLKLLFSTPESGAMDYLHKITNLDYYKPLRFFMKNLTADTLVPLFDFAKVETTDKLWKCIMHTYLDEKLSGSSNSNSSNSSNNYDTASHYNLNLVKHVIAMEVNSCSSSQLLFRSNTVASKLVTAYMLVHGGIPYLKAVLADFVNQVCTLDTDLEVDAKRNPSANVHDNMQLLMQKSQALLDKMLDTPVPIDICDILHHLRTTVLKRFGDQDVSTLYCSIGGLLCLRFICPSIIAPQKNGIFFGTPKSNAMRTLMLISKIIQQVANDGVLFGQKEAYMVPANAFLEANKSKIRHYFDKSSEPVSQNTVEQYTNARIEECKLESGYQARLLYSYYTIHKHFFTYLKQMQQLWKTRHANVAVTHYAVKDEEAVTSELQALEKILEEMGQPPRV